MCFFQSFSLSEPSKRVLLRSSLFPSLTSFFIVHILFSSSLFLFAQRCWGAPLISVLSTCAFIMAAAFCMGVHGLLVAVCLGCWGFRHNKFHVVPRTTVPVKFEIKKEASRALENPTSSASHTNEELSWSTTYYKLKVQGHGLYEYMCEFSKN